MFIPLGVQKDVEQMQSALRRQADLLNQLGLGMTSADVGVVNAFGRIVTHLREYPKDANLKRILYVLEHGHAVLDRGMRLERKFLTSMAVAEDLRDRIDRIDPPAGPAVWMPFRHWDGMRTEGGQIEAFRKAYSSLMAVVAKAEEDAAELRIRETLKLNSGFRTRPAKKVSKRSAGDAEYRKAVKGHNEHPPKNGGGGTSRDAKRRARKHQRA